MASLTDLIFGNELILTNILSFMDFKTMKIIRRVNSDWKRLINRRFIDRVIIPLRISHQPLLRSGPITVYIGSKPFCSFGVNCTDREIGILIGNRLTSYKNFYIQVFPSLMKNFEVAYKVVDKLLAHLWRPSVQVGHNLNLDKLKYQGTDRKKLMISVIKKLNTFQPLEA